MRWITRQNAHVDRTACPWLIRRLIDPSAEFVFVPAGSDPATLAGHTFDMRGGEYSHEGVHCTFEVMVERHGLSGDLALIEMGRIIRDADVPPSRSRRPEGAGLDAVIRGFQLSIPDDHEKLRLTDPLYDALYAYCQAKVATKPPKQGAPRPRLRYSRRVAEHLSEDEPCEGSPRRGDPRVLAPRQPRRTGRWRTISRREKGTHHDHTHPMPTPADRVVRHPARSVRARDPRRRADVSRTGPRLGGG